MENKAFSQEGYFQSYSNQDEERVPPTLSHELDIHSNAIFQPCAGGDDGLIPDNEDLVEAQITWDMGKELGFQVFYERAMLEALSKVKEVQDFSVAKKSGQPKKQRGQS